MSSASSLIRFWDLRKDRKSSKRGSASTSSGSVANIFLDLSTAHRCCTKGSFFLIILLIVSELSKELARPDDLALVTSPSRLILNFLKEAESSLSIGFPDNRRSTMA